MDRIRQLVEEIKEMEKDATHRSSLRIHSLLENNKALFLKYVDADDFGHLLSGFEVMADKNPLEYHTERYREEFKKNYQALAFYLNRII